MPRYPFRRVPDRPPYIARSEHDGALAHVADKAESILLLLGHAPGTGVSRTLKTFVEVTIPSSRFCELDSRYPVVLDLYSNADRDAVLILVLFRNALVETVNAAIGFCNLGSYLLGFDALYTHWLSKVNLDGESAIRLAPTTRGKVRRGVVKLVVNVGSAGMFHLLVSGAEFLGFARELGWVETGTVEAGKEVVHEGVAERTIDDINEFVRRVVVPRLSPRVRAAIGEGEVVESQLWMVMCELLVDSIIRIQADLKKGRLLFAVDAVDEAVLQDHSALEYDPRQTRFAIASLLANTRRSMVGSVLCGRSPVVPWVAEIQHLPHAIKDLGEIPDKAVRTTFKLAGLPKDVIDKILQKTGRPIIASNLSAICKALAINWSAHSNDE